MNVEISKETTKLILIKIFHLSYSHLIWLSNNVCRLTIEFSTVLIHLLNSEFQTKALFTSLKQTKTKKRFADFLQ